MGLAKKLRKKKAKQDVANRAAEAIKVKEKFKNMKTTEKESDRMSETSAEDINNES